MLTSVLTSLVLAFVGYRLFSSGENTGSSIVAIAMAAVIAGVMYVRNYKTGVAFAANHTLILTADTILVRDGASELKIPIAAVELLKIHRPPFGDASFALKVQGVPKETYYGYEHIDRLIASLARKLPSSRVEGQVEHA